MKRNIIAIMMVMVALLATQCKKSAEPLANEPAGETMEVTVRVENNTAKTDITAAGAVSWKKGDKLYVVGATQGLLGYVSAVADGDPAKFEGKITALTSAQVLRFYYVGDKGFTLDGSGNYTFNLGSQDGTLAGIAAHSQLMFGKTSNGVAIGTADFGTITMTSLMAIAHLSITNNTSNTVTVTDGFATSTFNAKTYDGAAALTGAAGNITMTSASAIGECYLALLPGTQTLAFRAGAKEAKLSQKDVAANTFYNSGSAIEVTMTLPEGALPGLFSVSGSKIVCFSKGNLQYDNGTWQFAEHQYDYWRGYNATQWDHFGWSTVNSNYGMLTSINASDYSGEFRDWGIAFCGQQHIPENTWYTLTQDEWVYLFNTRATTYGTGVLSNANHRYAEVTVKGTHGLLLFPDEFSWPAAAGTEPTTFNNYSANWNSSDYDDAAFAVLEAAGCVFLPAAGYRYSDHAAFDGDSANQKGFYRTSTGASPHVAINIRFANDEIETNAYGDSNARDGLSVRLVRNAN